MLKLAAPVVIAELGWMAMGVVDTMMVGRISAEAIGAVSIGGIAFHTVIVFGIGLLLGLGSFRRPTGPASWTTAIDRCCSRST